MIMRQPVRYNKVRVRITAAGKLYIALTLLVGIAGVNTANNLLYMIVASLLALMAVSGSVAYLALRRLHMEISPPSAIFAGSEAPVRITIHNARRFLPTFMLRLRLNEAETLIMEVPAQGEAETALPIRFDRRGAQGLGDVFITSDFPFGFFHRGGQVSVPGQVIVYPRPLSATLQAATGAAESVFGHHSLQRGTGGDFRSVRPYEPGDGLNRIYWRALARHGSLQIKEFDEEGGPPLLLSLESVPGPTLEERLGQLVTLVLDATRGHRPVGLDLPGARLEPGIGRRHEETLLRALALYRAA